MVKLCGLYIAWSDLLSFLYVGVCKVARLRTKYHDCRRSRNARTGGISQDYCYEQREERASNVCARAAIFESSAELC